LSASGTPSVGFVRVAPSRARIDRHEPTVGFTISTDRPFAEVIVATRPELFLAEFGSQRNEGNFFASRIHGLLKGPGELAYMLPAAFVAAVVGQTPRPNRLYFLAVGYTNERAEGATYSVPVEEWRHGLPSLEIAGDMHERSVAAALGIALSRLSRAGGAGGYAPTDVAAGSYAGGSYADEASVSGPRVLWQQEVSDVLPAARAVSLGDESGEESESHDESGWSGREEAEASSYGYVSHAHEDAGGAWDDYDDGYGDTGTPGAAALDSAYPVGAEAPSDLPDEEGEGSGYHDEAELGVAAETPANTPPPVAALDRVVDEVARGGRGTLFTVARPTERDGVAFGATQATQRSGALGALLARFSSADGPAFTRCFAPDAAALLAVTNAATEGGRMAPVGGHPLTDESWMRRFAAAGAEPRFVAEQRAFARQTLLEPLLPVARDLGLGTRGLALLAAVAVARGLDAGLRWALGGIGPAASPAQLQAALRAFGDADLSAFQRRNGLPPSGELDPRTHARLHAALRGLGERSPVPTLSGTQIVQSLVRQAAAEPIRHKLEHLANSPALDDQLL
jgi:hypothetical protein